MDFENQTPAQEQNKRIPSLEQVKIQIEKLCGGENPEVLRALKDEKGIYLHEVVTIDEKGDASLFSYRRSGNYAESKTTVTNIDVAYYMGAMKDDMCIEGDTLSTYDESTGEWSI